MARTDSGFRRQVVGSLVGLLAWTCVAAPGAAAAAGTDPAPLVPCSASGTGRVSASDRMSADLLEQGRARSATFDRLVSAIEGSDVMVVVMAGRVRLAGHLVFATANPYGRILRVRLTVPEIMDRLIPNLAHELQHALEVASDCTVVSPTTMAQFYRQQGHRVADGVFCTLAAREATRTVAREIETSRAGH